ncbi:MAG TPA: quinone-dependent dihydroorotate dehydrogenase [Longimicrobiaceae bacterium]
MSLIYRLARAPLFRMPPETAHEVVTGWLETAFATRAARTAARAFFEVRDPTLHVQRWGIDFPNPVGLAAGFDKAGSAFNALGALGFGFIEIGTVTAEAQPGNPRPRLFRLPEDEALLNRMGFNNPGAAAVAHHLQRTPIEPILGINLGKSKVTPLEKAAEDYLRSLDLLLPFARYLVVNVSSPNTPGLRSLQETEPLRALLRAVVERARARAAGGSPPPVLVKLSPDLTDTQAEEAVDIAAAERVSGVIAVNTTVERTGLRTPANEVERLGLGGISGRPLRRRALELVARIYKHTGGRIPIIGVGGIFTAGDAWERLRAGASLLQVYTGFIYQGPTIARDINRGLLARMRREGVRSIEEVVGSGG